MHRFIIHEGTGTILSLSECVMLEIDLVDTTADDVEQALPYLRDRYERIDDTCVCGHCDARWCDPEGDTYLDTHFECESCGEDYPMRDLAIIVNRHADPQTAAYICADCTDYKKES